MPDLFMLMQPTGGGGLHDLSKSLEERINELFKLLTLEVTD